MQDNVQPAQTSEVSQTVDKIPQPELSRTSEPLSKQSDKGNNFLVVLLSILLFIALIIAGFFAYQTQRLVSELQKMRNDSSSSSITTPTIEPTTDPTSDWKTYTNKSFSFRYPENYEIMEDSQSKIILGFKPTINDELIPFLSIFFGYQSTQPADTTEIKLDDIDAKKFDLHLGVDSDYQIVQVSSPKIELKMNVSGGGLARDFEQILSTFKFID